MRLKIAVAGATGFVGQQLGVALKDLGEVVALSRSERRRLNGYQEVRQTDLFSLKDCERALEGIDCAIYLVHSMLPSASLVQGHFADLDLLCADNFARAAKSAGVKQIIYLGGLMPAENELSDHLRSRLEVETVLAATGVPLTTLRAGMVIGPDGSSFQILARLVSRLPVMVCPGWTNTLMEPVALVDVVAAIAALVLKPEHFNQTYDLGCGETVSYRQLIERTASIMGRKRRLVSVPLFSPSLSRLWVSLTTGAPRSLIGPLIKSLEHSMIPRDAFRLADLPQTSLDTLQCSNSEI